MPDSERVVDVQLSEYKSGGIGFANLILDLACVPWIDSAGLTALETLHLNNNDLTVIPAGTFDGLTALTHLDLFSNDLTAISAGVNAPMSIPTGH